MREYGFGPNMLRCFNILYKDITARIMINGHMSDRLEIKRGIKQGDGLSGGVFNIGIDPLIRNILMCEEIRRINMVTPRTLEPLMIKVGAHADDVHVVCKSDEGSVRKIFKQYERLTSVIW